MAAHDKAARHSKVGRAIDPGVGAELVLHCRESLEVHQGLEDAGGATHLDTTSHGIGTLTVLESSVTEPPVLAPPSSRPSIADPAATVIVTEASRLPLKIVPAAMVAEVPSCQNTLPALAPPVRITWVPAPVVSVVPIWKMKI